MEALAPEQKTEIASLGGNDANVDRWFLRAGWEYIREHPWHTAGDGARKIAAAFCLLPSPRLGFASSLVYVLSYGPVMIFGLWGMWTGRRHWREHLIFYGLFASFALAA